jgi:spore coat polysaccharide biosynthesis predicted glycosyltransferase SpsG
MTREPVLFRVDGTRASGWESLSRCLVLAGALQRRRRPCHFLAQLEPTTVAAGIKRGGNEWLEADAPAGAAEDLEELIQEVRRLRPAAVVVDAHGCGPDYLAELVTLGPLVVSFDHRAQHRFPSQLVVNPTLAPGIEEYEVCPGTQVLRGRRYALVRPEIRRVRPIRAQEPPTPLRVLVAFGDDPHQQTGRVAQLLLDQSKVEHVDLIVRPQHPGLPELQRLAESNGGRLAVAVEPGEVAGRVSRCHFALCDANAWALEYACVGVPMLLMVQREEHWQTAQRLEEEGAAQCLGWHDDVTDQTIRLGVQNLAGDRLERVSLARCGRALIDGRGPDRLITALEILLHPSRQIDFSEAA